MPPPVPAPESGPRKNSLLSFASLVLSSRRRKAAPVVPRTRFPIRVPFPLSSALSPSYMRAFPGSMPLTFVALALWLIPAEGFGQITMSSGHFTPSPGLEIRKAKPGPWGELEYWEVWLEPPTQLILSADYLRELPVWRLPLTTPEKSREFFRQAGLTEAEIDALLAPANAVLDSDLLLITPPASLVETLTPERRAILYERLGTWEFNRFYDKPFTFGNDTVSSLAAASRHRIPQEVIEYADHLLYRRGPQNVLSDYSLAVGRLESAQLKVEFTKLLMRGQSYMVRLRVSPETDLDALRAYWQIDRSALKELPILEAVATTEGAGYLDLIHLLPPVPKQFFGTYPRASMAVAQDFPDCFWTAFNFLDSEPSARNLDFPVDRLSGTRWRTINGPLRFGDMIVIEQAEDGHALHACTYIADDLVYTKNGLSLLRPFVIQKLSTVLGSYFEPGTTRLRYLRHRDLLDEP